MSPMLLESEKQVQRPGTMTGGDGAGQRGRQGVSEVSRSQITWAPRPLYSLNVIARLWALALTSFVTLGKLLNVSVPHFLAKW